MTHNDIKYKDLFTFGWEKTKQHYWFLLGFFAINILLGILTSNAPVLNTVFSILATIAGISVLLQIVHGHTPQYKDLLKPFKNYKITWHYVLGLLMMLAALSVIAMLGMLLLLPESFALASIGFIALLLPAVYATIRLQFFRYFIVEDENMGPIHAFKKSISITRGKFWQLLGFICLLVLFNLVGLMLLFVGLLITVPVTMIAYTELYKKLSASHHA